MRNSELSLLNAMMEPENASKKKVTWVAGLVMALLTGLPAGLYLFRLSSVLLMQK